MNDDPKKAGPDPALRSASLGRLAARRKARTISRPRETSLAIDILRRHASRSRSLMAS